MRIATILRPVSAQMLAIAALGFQTVAHGQQFEPTDALPAVISTAPDHGLSTEFQFQKLPGATSAPVITALAGSRDGRFLAAAGDDHAIRIVDTTSGKTIQTVIGHQDWIQSLVFVYPNKAPQESNPISDSSSGLASDSLYSVNQDTKDKPNPVIPDLYSAGHDGRILRWKYSFPLEAEEVAIVPYAVRSISISAQRSLLAIGGFSDEVLIYDLAAGQFVQRLKCNLKDQRTVRFSPDGSRVLSGSRDGEIRVWDSQSGKLIAEYRHHQRRVHTAAFSPDGNFVTSAGEDRRVIRFDLEEQRVLWSTELAMSKMMTLCLVNEDMIAVAGADNKIRLLDAQSESVVAELTGHSGTVAVMTPCGGSLASGSFDTTVRLWNLTALERDRSRASLPTSLTPIQVDAKTQIR
ncbi:MAG: WD40 repeat domain-containing protein [Pirellulales bacterium]